MSEERKFSVWPWIAALLIALPVLYVASFGPACWLVDRGYLAAMPVAKTYLPIFQTIDAESWVGPTANWYGSLGAKYNPEWTMTRLASAAGLIALDGELMWPDLYRRNVPYHSNTY